MPQKIIIDTDPGCDDAIALITALRSPQFDVLGITSIGGNVDPALTQQNALGICALMDRTDVPVFAGCDKPLIKSPAAAADVHGVTGVQGLVLPFDRAAAPRNDMDAADFILSATRDHEDVTLIVIGPMTNIATAYLRDKSLPSRVKQIVTMGGAFGDPGGNMNGDQAEFNIFCDPDAAKIVYDNFSDIVVLPLDVTHKTLQDAPFRQWLSGVGTHGANIAAMLEGYAATYPADEMASQTVSPLHDFHAVAYLTDPAVYTLETGFVDVAVAGPKEGQTSLINGMEGPHRVALGIDRQRFFTVLHASLEHALR